MSERTDNSSVEQVGGNRPPLLAVYLFNGDDDFKRETLLKRLTNRIAESGDLLMNTETINPESLKDPDLLTDVLFTPPFGGAYRLVVVPGAEKLPKDLAEALIGYLESPSETTVLALLANKLATNTRLYKAINTYNPRAIIDVSNVKRSELPNKLRELAADYRLNMDYQAAQSLIDRVGTSMVALNNELKRLAAWALAAGKTDLTVGDIIAQVPTLVEPKPWELADALCQRDASQALMVYSEMHSASPSTVFLHCVARLREVLSIVGLKQRGIRAAVQVAEYMKRPEWQIRGSIQAANRFTEAELITLLKNAVHVEKALKSGADSEQVLTLWFLQICGKA